MINFKGNKIRVVIADDEPAARASMEILLSRETGIEIVASCINGKESVEAIINFQPDLVLLDIQMPEMNGFEALEATRHIFIPAIIFVTAYDQYALKAFEKSAVDYLLKPYDDARFYQSIERAKKIISAGDTQKQIQRIEELLTTIHNSSTRFPVSYQKRLGIKNNRQVTFIPVENIMFIESEGNFVNIHTQSGMKIANYTFKQLHPILDPQIFMRIHKSFMVNFDYIERIEPYYHGDYHVFLKNGKKLKLSRNYKESLDKILKQS